MTQAARARAGVRTVVVAALALGGAVQVVRSAVVQHTVASRPDVAAKLWPRHPRVALAGAMAEIGKAASAGQAPSATSVARSMTAAQHAPLAIEPLLIRGAIAQSEQDGARAERLFVEAARRDPRSAAARYFLSQHYLTAGRPDEGLRHAAVLGRLVAGGSAALVPALAAYAKSPGAIPTLRTMFAGDAALRGAVLSDLARDADNYGVIVALAGEEIGKGDPLMAPGWQGQLLRALVDRGDLPRARALWLQISGLRAAPTGIFNPQFAKLGAPAPFNWTFANGEFGFAEPGANASLQIIYYGRADAQFASQTLLLTPSTYDLRMRVTRNSEGADITSGLAWTVTCGKAPTALLTLPVGESEGSAQPLASQFTVPVGCPSQTIKLMGKASEFAASEQVSINDLQLVRLTS